MKIIVQARKGEGKKLDKFVKKLKRKYVLFNNPSVNTNSIAIAVSNTSSSN
jgi:hypothetical protein